MLTEWLEKEACADMAKTASSQFEEELSALDASSIAEVWREAKSKEAQVGQRLLQAIPGAVGGSLSGATLGGLTGMMAAPPEERWEGATRGALTGGALGAVGGGVGGALASPKRMAAAQKIRKDIINEISGQGPKKLDKDRPVYGLALGRIDKLQLPGQQHKSRSARMAGLIDDLTSPKGGVERAGDAVSTLGVVGGGAGAGLHEARKLRKEKEKQSSLKTPAIRRAGERVGDVVGTTAVSALAPLARKISELGAKRRAAREMLKRTGKSVG